MLNSLLNMFVIAFRNSEIYEYDVYIPAFRNITPNVDMIKIPVFATDTWPPSDCSFPGKLGKNIIVAINAMNVTILNHIIAYW